MLNLYSVFDSVSKEFASPIALKNHDVAKRWFHSQFLGQVDKSVRGDLHIYYIGCFNPDSGAVFAPDEIIDNGVIEDITEIEDSEELTKEIMNG